ncbi:hypothetical protein [Nocardia sp. CA-290969]|uniref:hypothetical protein n=1 Tax=Nocardia sp. CA-290969 TaxID=3239986 RepID=UPI003D89EAF3
MAQPFSTREQVETHLAQVLNPDRAFRVHPIQHGWVCSPLPTPQETAAGRDLGMTKLVVDSETGTVLEYPSWSVRMVENDYTEAKRTGRSPQGRQIHPKLWQVSLERIREDALEIEYLLKATSRANPPRDSEEYTLLINKQTLEHRPPGTHSALAMSWVQQRNSMNGAWPDQATFEY